jgi:integrase
MNLNEALNGNANTPAGRYSDELVKNLHLWVKPGNKKYWIYRYKVVNTRKDMCLGPYPKLSHEKARHEAIICNSKVVDGIDPIRERKATKAKISNAGDVPTFKAFSLKYIEDKSSEWRNIKHASQWINTLETYAFPIIGNLKLDEITTPEVLKVLKPIWTRVPDTANRLRGRLEKIISAATVIGYRDGINPALWQGHLSEVLTKPKKIKPLTHHPAMHYVELPEFIKKLKENGSLSGLAMEFTILTAARTSEVLLAKRSEIQGDIWIIPGERMKAGKEHHVPLTKIALEIIEVACSMDETSEYIFSRKGKTLSNMAMLCLLRRVKPGLTVHGFRSTFRDWVSEETSHSSDVAEMALAHTIKNKVESSYRRGNLFGKRKILMQDWQNYCYSK